MGIETVGDVGKDSDMNVMDTDNNPQRMGGGSPIETVGDVGMDNKGFSDNTMNHNPNKMNVPQGGKPIVSPGDVQM